MLIKAERSALLVVHVQGRLAPAVHCAARAIANSRVLMTAARRLGVPVLVPELSPGGLGHTVPEIAELAPPGAIVEEMHFSCVADDAFAERFRELGRGQAVVAGMEAHVCVLQGAMDLLDKDYEVFVVADAVASRTPENATAGVERLRAAGAAIVTTEMVVFEWMERADHPHFRELLELIK